MTDQLEAQNAPKRRGRKTNAEIEAEMRAQIEAEMRAQIDAEYAAKMSAVDSDSSPTTPTNGESLTVHFVEDGLTLLEKVWYRGEQVTVQPGTPEFAILSRDEFEQEKAWGKRFFRPGPWPGVSWGHIDDPAVTAEDLEILKMVSVS